MSDAEATTRKMLRAATRMSRELRDHPDARIRAVGALTAEYAAISLRVLDGGDLADAAASAGRAGAIAAARGVAVN